MPDDRAPEPLLSAQVLLRPRGAETTSPITAETLPEHEPDPEVAATLARYFRGERFDVGGLVGIGFAITAVRSRFEAVFGVRLSLEWAGEGRLRRVTTDAGQLELPLARLPDHVAEHLLAVTFTPPPDFGPGSFA
jgi:hypothetical protein